MIERVELVGGRLQIRAAPGRGVSIRALLCRALARAVAGTDKRLIPPRIPLLDRGGPPYPRAALIP
jgi:hypothetical protein